MAISKTAEVYDDLKEELLNGAFRPGAKLAIDGLATRYTVSASAIREALARLTSDRLVVAMPQRGFHVAAISREDLLDLTEVRVEIEARCLRRSIALGDVDWEAQLLATWHRLSRAGASPEGRGHPDWAHIHARFHDDLVAACDSKWWLYLRGELYVQAERYRRMLLPQVEGIRNIEAEHREILDLVLDRQTEPAVEALTRHMQKTTRRLLESGLVRGHD